MARQCQVCIHEKRFEIEQKMIRGINITTLAKEYNISYDSLYDHKKSHIPKSLLQVQEKLNLSERFDILTELEQIVSKTKDIFNLAYADEKYSTALKALDSQKGTYDVLCRMLALYQQTLALENENLKLKSGDNDEEREAEANRIFTEKIKVLTESELLILSKLQDKINNQSDEVIIADNNLYDNYDKLLDMLAYPEHYTRID